MTTNRTPIRRDSRWSYPPKPWEERPEVYPIEVWREHREVIMQVEARNGKRPPEWWIHDRGTEPPDNEAAALYEMGELRPDELDYLLPFWREHFDLAVSPNFGIAHPVGDPRGRLTTGLAARREWLEWAGIPHSLLTRWHAERRRRKAIDTLAKPI